MIRSKKPRQQTIRRNSSRLMEMLEARFLLSTYYVSNSGSDSNSGLDPSQPWATTAKVNATAFQAGDNILFQRGGEWHSKLVASSSGAAGNPITYGDYGDTNLAKPTFWGSDVIAPGAFTLNSGSTYTFPTSAVPGGNVYYVFANHQFMNYRTNIGDVQSTANSFTISGGTVYVNTGGSNPATSGVVYTASNLVNGNSLDSAIIASNAKNNLVFNNLVARESAGTPDGGGGTPDGYNVRVMGSSNVVMNNVEAYNGGKHHIGVINSTGFVGTGLYATGVTPGLTFGNASAFVSYADSGSNNTSQWIDCKVENYSPSQQSFYTHGNAMGTVLLQNLQSIGSGFAIGQDTPAAITTVKGGFVSGASVDIYGSNVTIDGMALGAGGTKIDLFGNNNIVQNLVDQGSTNGEGGVVVRGNNNIVRFNTFAHGNSGFSLNLKGSSKSTLVQGNIFTKTTNAINAEGGSTATIDYNFWDTTVGGTPTGLAGDTHLVQGDPKFNGPGANDYSLKTGSAAIDKVPNGNVSGVPTDAANVVRPQGSAFDQGAYEFAQGSNASPILDTFTATPSPVTVPNNITLTATAHDTDGSIASISFYRETNNVAGLQIGAGGDTLVVTDTTSPYTHQLATTGFANGVYTFYAQATDNQGATSGVSSANVTVTGGAAGTTYYVSPTGNDSNTGTDPSQAWKTVAKVNSMTFTPGTSILFARGGEWREALRPSASGAAGNVITYGAYGDGALAKPTFWGSDIIANNTFSAAGGNVYSVAATAINPSGTVNWVFANHEYLKSVASLGAVQSTANSWFLNNGTLYINSATNPTTNSVQYTAASREDVIFNNFKDYIAFDSLIGRETAQQTQGYVIRVQSGTGVTVTNSEAYNGGTHNIGVINSTGFVGTGLLASGVMPEQGFGAATAYIAYSDVVGGAHTSKWIDCKVVNYAGQPGFYTFGQGIGSVELENFVSLGSQVAISTDGPGGVVKITGGLIENQSLMLYGSNITVDGITIHGDAGRIDSQGNNNVIQNSLFTQTSQDGAVYIRAGNNSTVRFNTFSMLPWAGSTIRVGNGVSGTTITGNLISGTPNMIKIDGSNSVTSNYNFFDNTNGAPAFSANGAPQSLAQWQGAGRDANSVQGDPMFVSVPGQNFSLKAGSPAINKVPTAGISNIPEDIFGQPRLQGGTYDMGAYEFGGTAPATIAGNVYSDFNANGQKDGGENNVQNWQLYIDVNNNNQADAGEPAVHTDLNGNYAIMNLSAGTHFVKQVLKPTWRKTQPNGVPGYNQAVVAGDAITGKDFGNTHQALASGTIFNDVNGNGVKDGNEVGLAGWRVYDDANNNGQYDVGELFLITDANGVYRSALPAGTYRGRVEAQNGMVQTSPLGGFYLQTINQGDIFGNANFGFKVPAPAPLIAAAPAVSPAPAITATGASILSGSYEGLNFFSSEAAA